MTQAETASPSHVALERLRSLHKEAKQALAGMRNFGKDEAEALIAAVSAATLLLRSVSCSPGTSAASEANELRGELEDLRNSVDRLFVMLAARKRQIVGALSQRHAVSLWAESLQQTK